MKALITALSFAVLTPTFATSMHLEGTCQGTLADASAVSFSYYSNYDGCRSQIKAAVAFSEGELKTGSRRFRGGKDVYDFEGVKITFKDSTGNTSGLLSLKGRKAVTVHCEVRDYEYVDC